MPKFSKESAPQVEDLGVMVGHYGELDGYMVGFEQIRRGSDIARLMDPNGSPSRSGQ